MREYRFRHGVSSSGVTAEAAYTELERIRMANEEQRLDPHDIVEESRPKGAVLHPLFEWNDKVAGEQYRIWQARRLSRSVYVYEPAHDEEPSRESPAYFNVGANDYQPRDRVVERMDLWQLALQELHAKLSSAERALHELQRLKSESPDPDRAAAIALAAQGFEAVQAAVSLIR
jgi:hypothetical protein